jgi:hypothetical protein
MGRTKLACPLDPSKNEPVYVMYSNSCVELPVIKMAVSKEDALTVVSVVCSFIVDRTSVTACGECPLCYYIICANSTPSP